MPRNPKVSDREQELLKSTSSVLLGSKIVDIRYMTEKEMDGMGWGSRAIVLTLDNGTLVWPSSDNEGNEAGALYTDHPAMQVIGTL